MLFFEKNNQKEQYNGPARTGYSFTYSSLLNSSILYGGCKDNDVYLFDQKKKSWICKSTSAKKYPSFRKYHAACFVEQNSTLLISGGQDQNGRSLDDFHQLSLKDFKWNSLIIQKESVPREKHSLIPLSKSEVLLFGGVSLPYKDYLNDCWILTKNESSRYQNKQQWQSKKLQVKGFIPQGACFRQSTVILGDRLFCASQSLTNLDYAPIQLYCMELKSRVWRKLEYKFVAHQLKFYKTILSQNEEGIVISLHESQKGQNPRFFLFSQNSPVLNQLQIESNSLSQLQPFIGDNSWTGQVVCGGKGKRLFSARFRIQQRQVLGSIEQYLIAIKNQQMLAQQLGKKNTYLQDLYKQMQTYISQLNKSYQNYKRDQNIDMVKERHIEDCQYLKEEYTRLNGIYEQSCKSIRDLRGELSAIDEEFERCIQTEFDQQA